MSEEIDRLKVELERAQAREARLRQDSEAHQIFARQWQTRAEEAERRAEEAERELSRIQGSFPGFNNAWRAIGQAFANVTGQVIDDSVDAIFLPGDEGQVDYQDHDLDPAGQGEREAHSSSFSFDQDIVMTDDEISPVFAQPSMRRSSRVGQVSGLITHARPSPPHLSSLAETIGPSDGHAAPNHVAGWRTDVTNPTIEIGGWDLHGDVVERRPDPSEDAFYEGWPPMAPLRPKPRVMDSVAAGKQPELPSPAKEASSATGGDPPKPTSTKSYTGATKAPPP